MLTNYVWGTQRKLNSLVISKRLWENNQRLMMNVNVSNIF